MSLFLNDLISNGGRRSMTSPRQSAPRCSLFLPARDKASFACADGMRNIFTCHSIFERTLQLGYAWGS
jgi:hypothetical protein